MNRLTTEQFDWLSLQKLDFYLNDYNVAIECQGIQHEKPIERFGGEEEFEIQQEHDKRKREYANKNGYKRYRKSIRYSI